MSSSGCITLAVLVLGGAFCWFSLADGERSGYRTADFSHANVRSMHLQVAERLRSEGLEEAAQWHERMAGRGGQQDANDHAGPGAEGVTEEANDADRAVDPAYAGGVRAVDLEDGG